MSGGVGAAKQLSACWDYITASNHLRFGGMLLTGAGPSEAAAAVKAGEAAVVVAAYRVADLDLTGEIEAAGGRVEYVHRPTGGRLTARAILATLYRKLGWSAHRIAQTVDADTDDVLDHLRRAGIPKPRRHE
jgi:hypothetical protein